MGCTGRVVCLGIVCVCLWFNRQQSGTWCDHPEILLGAWFYCGGSISCRLISRFVWLLGWTSWVLFLLLIWLKHVCCVRAREVGIFPRIINGHPMWRMLEGRVWLRHCGMSFIYTDMYITVLTKRFVILRSVFLFSSNFRNAPTDAVHLQQLTLWVHWYIGCICSRSRINHGQILVVVCPHLYRIVMLENVLLIHCVMKCAMWMIFYPVLIWMMWGKLPPSLPCELGYDQPII